MAVVKTLEEVVAQRINECHMIVGDNYHLSVRAIFASLDGKYPQLVGSCTLVALKNRKFVVTAAHVIDWSEKHNN